MFTGYTPIYRIEKGGLDITGHFNDRCTQLRVDYATDDDDVALFTLDDRDWIIARPSVGDRLKIYLGYIEVGLCYMGDFEVNKVTFSGLPKSIILKCTATGQRNLYKSQMTMNLEGKTLGEIAGIMAGKGGIQALVHPKVADIVVPMRNMTTSPMQMIAELKRQYGLVMKVKDGKLITVPIDGGESASGQTMPTIVLSQEHFGAWEVEHTEQPAYSSVRAAYVDPETYVTTWVEHALPKIEGIENLPFVPNRKFNTKSEAEAAAKSQAQALQRSLGVADLQLAKGDPWISEQQRLLIRDMRDGVNGSYVTDLVSHTYIKDQGILTAIKAKPDSNGTDYESLFYEASPADRERLFLQPNLGGLVGELFARGRVTAGTLIEGVNPFQ